MTVPWNYENAAHLLRRVGFGATPTDIQDFLGRFTSVQGAVDNLLSFKASKSQPPSPRNNDDEGMLKLQAWWLSKIVNANSQSEACQEKLVLFWHSHLVSGAAKQPTLAYMAGQNGLFRYYARGNFMALVRELNRDPANLYYLDGISNAASDDGINVNANENFGREVMELFLLGRVQFGSDGSPDPTKPNYTESDVHQLSRALTGWTSINKGLGVWNQNDWDGGRYDDNGDGAPDPVTIFGVTNSNFRIDSAVAGSDDDVLKLLFSRTDSDGKRQVGVFLSRKLWTWYAYPPPAAGFKGMINDFADVFTANNFELTPLLKAMWTHDAFYSEPAKTRTVKNPVDYAAQAMRAFDVRTTGKGFGTSYRQLGEQLALMNMRLFDPPSVGGWPGGLGWINVGTLLARLEFAKDLAADGSAPGIELAKIKGLLGSTAADPGATVDRILAQMGLNASTVGTIPPSRPLPLTSAQRDILLAYATNNGFKSTLNLKSATTADAKVKARGLIALALQAAENQVF